MKTIKKKTEEGFEYKRVTDSEADKLVTTGWQFCPKTEWKINVRDFGKVKDDSSSSEDKYKKNKKNRKNEDTSKVQ
jgi:hypothetical protein